MIRLRAAAFVICLGVVGYSAAPLFAEPATVFVCCEAAPDCSATGLKCCRPEVLGVDDCEPDRPSYCLVQCIPQSSR